MTCSRRPAPGLVASTILLALACSEAPTSPGIGPPEAAPSGSVVLDLAGDEVQVVKRTVPLAEDVVVEQTVGPLGGVITLPGAGLTVSVPPGAVSAPTTITVVAPAGSLVGYHFYPAGLTFDLPLTAAQDLTETNALALALETGLIAAYFQGDLSPTVQALEVLPLSLLETAGSFQIDHFSGYVVATM